MSPRHILFFSTHHALWAESVLADAGHAPQVVSVPRHLSSDCGYCVRLDGVDDADIAAALEAAGVPYDRILAS